MPERLAAAAAAASVHSIVFSALPLLVGETAIKMTNTNTLSLHPQAILNWIFTVAGNSFSAANRLNKVSAYNPIFAMLG